MDAGKIAGQAASALGLNDTSVDAKLILNGQEYEIETFNIRFRRVRLLYNVFLLSLSPYKPINSREYVSDNH